MSRPDYKGPARKETARRVRERSEGVNPSRGLDEALDDRIGREEREDAEAYWRVTEALWPYWQQQTSMPAEAAVAKLLAERDRYRQAALELQAGIRAALAWIDMDAEPAVAHSALRKAADKWLPVLKALEEGLKVPDPSGGSQDRGPESSTPEERGPGGP